MFKEGGFKIYESTNKKYVIKNIYDELDGFSKLILDVREVLDKIKTKFYDLKANIVDWENSDRKRISAQ